MKNARASLFDASPEGAGVLCVYAVADAGEVCVCLRGMAWVVGGRQNREGVSTEFDPAAQISGLGRLGRIGDVRPVQHVGHLNG
jgi:hypothetical protein